MSLLSGSLAVPATSPSVFVSVATTLVLPYQVGVSATWVTDFAVTTKSAAGFTVVFSTPAPAGGGTLDWFVSGITTLATGPTAPISDADIASDALVMLGEDAITSLDDDSDAARVSRRLS